MNPRYPTLTFMFALLSVTAAAQVNVTGKVVDEAGKAIVGANVLIKGTYDGASTDSEGLFEFVTTEQGRQLLVATSISFETIELEIALVRDVNVTLKMKEAFNELDAVVISAGSFTAGDDKRRTILKAVDIATTAGATADIAGALNTLPGTTKVGETGKLFVRGGDDSEARTFIDGMVVLNPYSASAPNTPTRTRFMPFMFKGTSFSTGGYAAEYGQALSSALILNSKDKAETTQTDIGILSVGGDVAHTQVFKNSSIGGKVSYTSLSPYYKIVSQRLDWTEPYTSWDGNLAYRQEVGNKGGTIKSYGKYTRATLGYNQPTISDPDKKYSYEIDNEYAYGNIAASLPIGEQWQLRGGLSYSYNDNDMRIGSAPMREQEKGVHAKAVLEHALSNKIEVISGAEVISRDYTASRFDTTTSLYQAAHFRESITAVFSEGEFYITDQIITRAGVRFELNSLNQRVSIDPRISIAYKPFGKGQFAFAYGTFKQSPRNEYLRVNNLLFAEQAEHFILNYQAIKDNRTFRIETYYKKYRSLVKFDALNPNLTGNEGFGFARGAEVFWRDSKTLKNVDYWISYSFLDTKRNYLNYPYEVMPTFASRHNVSLVYKHFITRLKSQLGVTYAFASPRPYNNPNQDAFNGGRTPAYHDLSANVSYLPKNWIIVHFSCTNLLGRNNIFGYEYSATPDTDGVYASRPITQPARHLLLVAVFLTISKNKSVNQLPNL